MDLIGQYVDVLLHLDRHLGAVIADFGIWTYLILFAIVFCETGLVIMPFLPGDSLLFTAGAFAAKGALDITWLFIGLSAASFLGDNVNYWVGRTVGKGVAANGKLVRREHLQRTEKFYDKYGGKTIILARFMPVLRTFAPFVAGIGRMDYPRFLAYSFFGSLVWNSVFVLGGYTFGNMPLVRDNFTAAIFLIIFVSLIPTANEVYQHYRMSRQKKA
jgi:membrane-associated protein